MFISTGLNGVSKHSCNDPSNCQEIVFLGYGAHAKEVEEFLSGSIAFVATHPEFFPKDTPFVNIAEPTKQDLEHFAILTVGAPGLKKEFFELWQGQKFAQIISNSAYVASTATISPGCTVGPNSSIMNSAIIGNHVSVGANCVVSHDSVIGDFTTLAPGVLIAGEVKIGQGCFIGIGATIKNGIQIGDGAIIGAGTVVISDVISGEIVAGVPSRPLGKASVWLTKI